MHLPQSHSSRRHNSHAKFHQGNNPRSICFVMAGIPLLDPRHNGIEIGQHTEGIT
jgi:hypothetical protein